MRAQLVRARDSIEGLKEEIAERDAELARERGRNFALKHHNQAQQAELGRLRELLALARRES